MITEDQLIGRISRKLSFPTSRAKLRLGIGDDAAIVPPSAQADWVLSSDTSLEGVHFLADTHPADSVGYKALARAISDLAAMGATPLFFLLTLALPAGRTGKWLDRFLAGLGRAARLFRTSLIGGDTTKSPTIFISITVVGRIAPGRAITRSGARPGDRIYVSGTLGAAQLGLRMIQREAPSIRNHSRLRAHLYPRVRTELGAWLAQQRVASAMIDISDGLSTDLGRLCAASGVGASIWADRIPCVHLPAGARRLRSLARLRLNPLKLALDGGEDYELLFTVSPRREKRLRGAPGFAELTEIGEIVASKGVTLVGKAEKHLLPGGWDPFA
jgi:thiamine-monophosphate kinase